MTLDSVPFIAAPGLDPSALAKIGDDAHNDLVPAKSLGLTTILVRTGKQVGPAEKALADFTVNAVSDLRSLLQ